MTATVSIIQEIAEKSIPKAKIIMILQKKSARHGFLTPTSRALRRSEAWFFHAEGISLALNVILRGAVERVLVLNVIQSETKWSVPSLPTSFRAEGAARSARCEEKYPLAEVF